MMFSSPDTLIPDPYNPLDWNRYRYARGNPLRYTDPPGHFSEDQLEKWYGDNWMVEIVERYSEEMVFLLTLADFGDMITYDIRGETFGAVFVQGETGNLVAWDVGSKSCTIIESIDKNSISGFYTRDKDSLTEYSLAAKFSENAKNHVSLPMDWRRGNKEEVGGGITNISIEPPSALGWIGLGTTVVGVVIGGPMIPIVLGCVGFSATLVDMVKIETGDTVHDYWMPHNPVPGEPNPPQWMGPPVGTPELPVPLY